VTLEVCSAVAPFSPLFSLQHEVCIGDLQRSFKVCYSEKVGKKKNSVMLKSWTPFLAVVA